MLKINGLVAALFFVAFCAVEASASIIVFSGQDTGAGPGSPHPNSSAAAANFDAAAALLGNVTLINFESAPLGTYTNLTIAPGVSINGTNVNGVSQSILNTPNFPTSPQLDGFNTTVNGTHYAEIFGGNLTFTFATPVQSFGTYLTGVQTAFFADAVQFSDGTSQTVSIPGAGTSSNTGALDFVGFTDAGKSISSITINAGPNNSGADAIGIDDVRIQSVPEPASLVMVAVGMAIGIGSRRRRAV